MGAALDLSAEDFLGGILVDCPAPSEWGVLARRRAYPAEGWGAALVRGLTLVPER